MKTYKIHLLRHGMTSANKEGKYVGITDVPLCEEGIRELEELKENCEYPGVGKVYSSPLTRAVQTAQILYPAMTPCVVQEISECNFGVFENKTMAELQDVPVFRSWLASQMMETPPGGESMKTVEERVLRGFENILLDMMKNNITSAAVVAHGGVLMTLLSRCGLPKQPPLAWTVGNGKGYTVMTYTQLWSRDKLFEIYDPLPYGDTNPLDPRGYAVLDLPEADEEEPQSDDGSYI